MMNVLRIIVAGYLLVNFYQMHAEFEKHHQESKIRMEARQREYEEFRNRVKAEMEQTRQRMGRL